MRSRSHMLRPTTARVHLQRLLSHVPKARFLADTWPNAPLVVHGPLSRFGALPALPALRSVRALCELIRGPVQLLGPRGFRSHLTHAKDGVGMYEAGYTLYFTRVETVIPQLKAACGALARDLGVRPNDVQCEAFAGVAASGGSMHFDFDTNFNLQLKGEKDWWLAPNDSVRNPLNSFHVGDARPSPVLRYAETAMPTRMPASARQVRVREGSLVFVPRGYWHETRTRGESFALCFSVKPPPLLDLVLAGLRDKMLERAEWREVAFGIAGVPTQRKALAQRLRQVCGQLQDLARDLKPAELLALADEPSEQTIFAWPHGARRSVVRSRRGAASLVLRFGGRVRRIPVGEELVPFVRWAAQQPRIWVPRSRLILGEADRSLAMKACLALLQEGLLSVVEGEA